MSSHVSTSVSSVVFAVVVLVGCGGSNSPATFAQYRIVATGGGELKADVGDAFHLSVVMGLSDGTTKPLASDAKVTWSGPPVVTALPVGSTPSDSLWPQPGATATAMWIKNPEHLSDAQVAGVLYVLNAGSAANPAIDVTASVAGGAAPAGKAMAAVSVAPLPAGDVTRGQPLYAANCSSCHGAQGEGGSTGPGLNGEPDHVAGDPGWSPQMLGLSARSNMDDLGVSLGLAMPKWLLLNGASGQLLTTQNFADIYTFLKTQRGVTPAP
jgi:mono/diheme cytochrome c family protein